MQLILAKVASFNFGFWILDFGLSLRGESRELETFLIFGHLPLLKKFIDRFG
jgi:hypothetical protein